MQRAAAELDHTDLAGAPVLAVSRHTGQGLDELRSFLADLVRSLPQPAVGADVRLWDDRCFHIKGAGTVVTGTLPAGTVHVGDFAVEGRPRLAPRSAAGTPAYRMCVRGYDPRHSLW